MSFTHRSDGQRLIDEFRDRDTKVTLAGQPLRLFATGENPEKFERRTARLFERPRSCKHALAPQHADKNRPAYKVVCWRSMTVVADRRRIVTLERSGSFTWHTHWWNSKSSSKSVDEIKKDVEEAAALAQAPL